jgi:hypothetical protein
MAHKSYTGGGEQQYVGTPTVMIDANQASQRHTNDSKIRRGCNHLFRLVYYGVPCQTVEMRPPAGDCLLWRRWITSKPYQRLHNAQTSPTPTLKFTPNSFDNLFPGRVNCDGRSRNTHLGSNIAMS